MAAAGVTFAEGTPCWIDVMLPDLEAGKRFYGELFGWTYGAPAPPDRGSCTEALLDGGRVAALVYKRDGRLPTAWTLYFATPDAAATAGRVRAAGGQLVTEPLPPDEDGTTATAVDPGGAAFGLWQPGTRPGAPTGFEVTHRPGSYVWTEVCTREKEAVDAFYTEVFGYGMHPTGGRERREGAERKGSGAAQGRESTGATGAIGDTMVWTLPGESADDAHAIGARTMIDSTYPVEMPAHFLVYFAVDGCDTAVRATTRLGGRTVEDPRDTPFGRRAVVVDNQGARFGVLDTSTTV
ncbi:MAG TPA: VOC family protein [Streptomyces sp.]|nr:VOC family protein [Streptomyces sp.]